MSVSKDNPFFHSSKWEEHRIFIRELFSNTGKLAVLVPGLIELAAFVSSGRVVGLSEVAALAVLGGLTGVGKTARDSLKGVHRTKAEEMVTANQGGTTTSS